MVLAAAGLLSLVVLLALYVSRRSPPHHLRSLRPSLSMRHKRPVVITLPHLPCRMSGATHSTRRSLTASWQGPSLLGMKTSPLSIPPTALRSSPARFSHLHPRVSTAMGFLESCAEVGPDVPPVLSALLQPPDGGVVSRRGQADEGGKLLYPACLTLMIVECLLDRAGLPIGLVRSSHNIRLYGREDVNAGASYGQHRRSLSDILASCLCLLRPG